MKERIEHDTLGEIRVPSGHSWGAQTQRSLENFRIGTEKMPEQIIAAFSYLKQAAAEANAELGLLEPVIAEAVGSVCRQIRQGELNSEFPLSVWQTGSGTHSNMNINEVIAHKLNAMPLPRKVHPNDDINMGQSSNDTFPTALHVAALLVLTQQVLPSAEHLENTLRDLSKRYNSVVKIGRTHLQDATPLTLGQEIGGWAGMLATDREQLTDSLRYLRRLAIGGTAVGTGLNADPRFGALAADKISRLTGEKFTSAENKFESLTSKNAVTFAHGALTALAADLLKIANDVRLLASGPRCGIGEIRIPANEPGSSIMPGKVNPTQCEALTMVCVQVMGNESAIAFAASQGNFELNVNMPVIAYNFLQSAVLLSDAMASFDRHCASGIEPVPERIRQNLERSLMLVTALNPHIGYESAAAIAKAALANGTALREEAISSGLLTGGQFDEWVDPAKMAGQK